MYISVNGQKTFVYAGYKESPARWEKGTEPEPIKWYAGMQYDGDIARAALAPASRACLSVTSLARRRCASPTRVEKSTLCRMD